MKFFIFSLLFLNFPMLLQAEIVPQQWRTLEAGNFADWQQESNFSDEEKEIWAYFYKGNLELAQELIHQINPLQASDRLPWLAQYLETIQPFRKKMIRSESENFIVLATPQDAFLVFEAQEALEQAYARFQKIMPVTIPQKIFVEIYPDQDIFAAASTLSVDIQNQSGAVAICKFRRLMILSPKLYSYGYRWKDTLVHELTHYFVNQVSNGQCPLWLHEGIARYLQARWRLDQSDCLTPGGKTELMQAVKENRWISYARMEPSLVYLKDRAEVGLAFEEVAYTVYWLTEKKGEKIITLLLEKFSQGLKTPDIFKSILKLDFSELEDKVQQAIRQENFPLIAGALSERVGIYSQQEDAGLSPGAAAYVRLGDRYALRGDTSFALEQYDAALKEEPYQPLALTRKARILIEEGNIEEARKNLTKVTQTSPNYAPPFAMLGKLEAQAENWEAAKAYFIESLDINPFDLTARKLLITVAEKMQDTHLLQQQQSILKSISQ